MKLIWRRQFPAVFAIFLAWSALEISAQAPRTLNAIERRIEIISRQSRDFERDDLARGPKSKRNPADPNRTREIRTEIQEDLASLQRSYNAAVTALQTTSELPARFVEETGRAVLKPAQRLMENLALPSAEDDSGNSTTPAILPDTDRKLLKALCRAIYELITNPMFEGAGTIDVKNGTKASADLHTIVDLAERIPKAQTAGH